MNKYPKPETAHELIERANAAIDWGIEAATIERCAQWHDEQEKLFRKLAIENLSEPCPLPDVSTAQDQVADWHKQSAAAIRALKDQDNVR